MLQVGKHTKATMYRMNTRLKQTPLPTQLSSLTTTNSYNSTNLTHDNSYLPTFLHQSQVRLFCIFSILILFI